MNYPMIIFVLGRILLCVGALLVLPLLVSAIYTELSWTAFAIAMAICILPGVLMSFFKPKNRILYLRDGFAITALSWILISIVGAVPFVISGYIPNPVDALFETVSGFTTTGASILSNVEALPHGLLFWRSFTHWIGGMGVLVFLLSVLRLSGGSHVNLMKAESPGPQVEKLAPKVQSTAKILYGIYIILTVAEILLLLLGNMPLFDAVTTSFGTAGTGGFGIKNDSMAGYSVYLQNVVTVFMALFGINFNFYFFLLLRKVKRAFSMQEVRVYIGIILAAVAVIAWDIHGLYTTFGESIRHAAFQVSSIITTTGFSTTDFDHWPQLSKGILLLLMFIGACAGSTGGGLKVSRCIILFRSAGRECKRLLHPQRVDKIFVDGKSLSNETVRSVHAFLVAYVCVFVASLLLISLDNFDFSTNFSAVAATLNNIGPGLELVGPTQNFGFFSNGAKLVMIFDMLAGRLELFPLLLLFRRETWRRF